MSTYTPTTATIRAEYAGRVEAWEMTYAEQEAARAEEVVEFDRWLAAHDAEVAAQALSEAADRIHVSLQQAHKRAGRTLDPMFSQYDQGLWRGYKNAENWLRARANRIEQGGQP